MLIKAGERTTLKAIPLDMAGLPATFEPLTSPIWTNDAGVGTIRTFTDKNDLWLNVVILPNCPNGDITFTVTDATDSTKTGTFVLTVTS